MVAAQVGDYEVEVLVGPSGIAAGGTLLVAFPRVWFTNPYPIVKPIQQEDSRRPHYVAARTSRTVTHLAIALDKVGGRRAGAWHRRL